MVNQEIQEIIKFLQDTYGKMSVNEIEEETTKIKNVSYDPTKSINLLLTAVQEHADLLKIAGAELQDSQVISLAYFLISKYHLFQDALKTWNQRPNPKTWDDLKMHMRQEYQMLKEINALSIRDSALHTTDLVHELKTHQENIYFTQQNNV